MTSLRKLQFDFKSERSAENVIATHPSGAEKREEYKGEPRNAQPRCGSAAPFGRGSVNNEQKVE